MKVWWMVLCKRDEEKESEVRFYVSKSATAVCAREGSIGSASGRTPASLSAILGQVKKACMPFDSHGREGALRKLLPAPQDN
jgi:hypothetical protein